MKKRTIQKCRATTFPGVDNYEQTQFEIGEEPVHCLRNSECPEHRTPSVRQLAHGQSPRNSAETPSEFECWRASDLRWPINARAVDLLARQQHASSTFHPDSSIGSTAERHATRTYCLWDVCWKPSLQFCFRPRQDGAWGKWHLHWLLMCRA